MGGTVLILFLLAIALLIVVIIYGKRTTKIFKFKASKVSSDVSIVFITKNNYQLLKQSLSKLKSQSTLVKEIVILDLGSIDNTTKMVKTLLSKDTKIKFFNISHRVISDNYYRLIKDYVYCEVILVIDFYKINLSNPMVYIPQLFKPLNKISLNNMNMPDPKIDGTHLLLFDRLEREKNTYVMKEYVIEALNNIRINLEVIEQKCKKDPCLLSNQIKDLEDYTDKCIKDSTFLLSLIGISSFPDIPMVENLMTVFKDYGENHNVSINYKLLGKPYEFKTEINNLVLSAVENLLYTIVQYNMCSVMDIICRYSRKQFQMLMRYEYSGDDDTFFTLEGGLGYFVLQSLQNNLSLIGGNLRIKCNPKDKILILIQIPVDTTTTLQGNKYENTQ